MRRTRGEHASIAEAARRLHAFADAGEEYEAAFECHTDTNKLVYQPIPKLRDLVTADALALAASLIQRGFRIRFDYGDRVTTLSEYDRVTGERCIVVFTGTRRPRIDPDDGVCVACSLHFRHVQRDASALPMKKPEPGKRELVEGARLRRELFEAVLGNSIELEQRKTPRRTTTRLLRLIGTADKPTTAWASACVEKASASSITRR